MLSGSHAGCSRGRRSCAGGVVVGGGGVVEVGGDPASMAAALSAVAG